ncbi:MAG: gliding-motility protein MglA [Myxococcota bacterium]
MAQFNRQKREVSIKVVYYGPGLSGKTTNLVQLHGRYPEAQRGRLVKLDTEQERTLFFDYMPVSLGTVRSFAVRVDFFTVPGQSYYNVSRRTVLSGADGVVFVADSDPRREDANLVSHENFVENLTKVGIDLASLPLVYQWNKRDVPGALGVKLMQTQLGAAGRPGIEAVAARGVGVWETERQILALTLKNLRRNAGEGEAA